MSYKRALAYPVLLVSLTLAAQTSPKVAPEGKPDFSKEAYVVEERTIEIAYQGDGTSATKTSARVRIQSEAGLKIFGVLSFAYQKASESIAIQYVRVRKESGDVISTPPESARDMEAEVARQAPLYTDEHQLQIAVRGLGVGDVIEYEIETRNTVPLAKGEFWGTVQFVGTGIILRDTIRISVPAGRAVKYDSPEVVPTISEERGRRFFAWSTSRTGLSKPPSEDPEVQRTVDQIVRGRLPVRGVWISSFPSWEAVGSWYEALQAERIQPTTEIRAKAAELTKGLQDDDAKARAIYRFVSLQFRYIGVNFGIGRYQPHAAGEILANRFGDCKDKHTLLASLLSAAGITAYPALVSSIRDVDINFPSPGQFDHVVTVAEIAGKRVWLDSTPEVAPFGYLISTLLGKPALVMPLGKPAALATAPDQEPTKSLEAFRIDAKLVEAGTLSGKAEYSFQGGDDEVVLRAALRTTSQANWKDVVEPIARGGGFAGDVTEPVVSAPEATDSPLTFSYSYTRKDYPDWSDRNVAPALPFLSPRRLEDEYEKLGISLWIGQPVEYHYESHIELPRGYRATLPKNVHLSERFADYRVDYTFQRSVLSVDERLLMKSTEVRPGEFASYKRFLKELEETGGRKVNVSFGEVMVSDYMPQVWALPFSKIADANKAYNQARERANASDNAGAIASLGRALEADPQFVRALLWQGELRRTRGDMAGALEAFRKAIWLDPDAAVGHRALASSFMESGKTAEVLAESKELIRVAPTDPAGYLLAGLSLSLLKRNTEAAEAFEEVVKIAPESPFAYMNLGTEYFAINRPEKAREALQMAVSLNPLAMMFNYAASSLVDANADIPLGLEFAKKAVAEEERASRKLSLEAVQDADLVTTRQLAVYWDTLGWAYFRSGDTAQASDYLNSAWSMKQDGRIADHLGQLYDSQKNKPQAVRFYKMAVSKYQKWESAAKEKTEARLRALPIPPARPGMRIPQIDGYDEANAYRTVALPRIFSGTATADVLLILSQERGMPLAVKEVKFLKGGEELKSAESAIRKAAFKMRFPKASDARILRRGIVGCYPASGCSLTLLLPEDVQSVN